MNTYIIRNGEVIATVDTELKNGTVIEYAFQKGKEELDTNREYNLINSKTGKISRAKKYNQYRHEIAAIGMHAIEINPKEFFIENLYQHED